jgi:subtilisin family serine protease
MDEKLLRSRATEGSEGPLELVKLTPLMLRTSGRAEIMVAVIDGPVATDNSDFAGQRIHQVGGKPASSCSRAGSFACVHGTFVAGMLSAKRGSVAPAICPGCTLLVRPIFSETASNNGDIPSAGPEELATALVETINAGARVINLSAALVHSSAKGESELEKALGYAVRRKVIVVAAVGNQGTIGSSIITRHPWVIPVTGCDLRGVLTAESNLSSSIGRNGVMAPAKDIASLGTSGKPQTSGGTSAAAPFVTGTIALLWSEFPSASAAQIKSAVTHAGHHRRRTIAPPLLNAWAAYQVMRGTYASIND